MFSYTLSRINVNSRNNKEIFLINEKCLYSYLFRLTYNWVLINRLTKKQKYKTRPCRCASKRFTSEPFLVLHQTKINNLAWQLINYFFFHAFFTFELLTLWTNLDFVNIPGTAHHLHSAPDKLFSYGRPNPHRGSGDQGHSSPPAVHGKTEHRNHTEIKTDKTGGPQVLGAANGLETKDGSIWFLLGSVSRDCHHAPFSDWGRVLRQWPVRVLFVPVGETNLSTDYDWLHFSFIHSDTKHTVHQTGDTK